MALMFVLFGGLGIFISLAGFGIKPLLDLDEAAGNSQ
jgi:hypothetical protein